MMGYVLCLTMIMTQPKQSHDAGVKLTAASASRGKKGDFGNIFTLQDAAIKDIAFFLPAVLNGYLHRDNVT